ncbi:MAG: hypothetical protein LC753_14030 [Acidobacteria bacterium]|nr:hypothetical protein [Acidobacteriota bacterium]MCA1651340.1 hypothetical protein [Acidobacteriota bacterium]
MRHYQPVIRPLEATQMTILQKLFSRKAEPRPRVRICVECGMPIAEHKDWCSILRTQQEYSRKDAPERA